MMRMTLISSAHLPPALPSAPDQTPPSPLSPISPLPPPAHASATASPAPASVSSSTAVDPAADTPMRSPAAHLPMMSMFPAPPAAKASLSAARRLRPFNWEIGKKTPRLQNLLSKTRLDDAGHSLQQILGHIHCTVDNRHHAGHDSRTVAKSLAPLMSIHVRVRRRSLTRPAWIEGRGWVQKAQMNPTALARGDGRGIRGIDVMRSTRCTGARRIFIMSWSCQAVDAGFHYLLILENNRARLVHQYCAVLASFTVQSMVDRGCLNLFHHHANVFTVTFNIL